LISTQDSNQEHLYEPSNQIFQSRIVFKYSNKSTTVRPIKMHLSIIFPTVITTASLIYAAPPAPRQSSEYYGITVNAITSLYNDPFQVSYPIQLQLNQLASCNGTTQVCSVSELTIDPSSGSNIDPYAVECRGYQDFDGVRIGSAAFTVDSPAIISETDVGPIAVILCYVVEVFG